MTRTDSEKISVIIPVYNTERYLRECLDSVCGQTYTNLEVILVNDASTDRSPDICREYVQKDPRFILVEKQNGGLSSARNAGLDRTTGDCIAFLDSDDFIEPNTYEALLSLMHRYQTDISACSFLRCNEDSSPKSARRSTVQTKLLTGWEPLEEMFLNMSFLAYAWNKLYRAEYFRSLRFPEGKHFEDMFTNYQVFRTQPRVAFSDQQLCNYRIRAGSIMHRGFNKSYYDMRDLAETVLQAAEADPRMQTVLAGCIQQYLFFIGYLILGRHRDDAVTRRFTELCRRHEALIRRCDKLSPLKKLQIRLCARHPSLYRRLYLGVYDNRVLHRLYSKLNGG